MTGVFGEPKGIRGYLTFGALVIFGAVSQGWYLLTRSKAERKEDEKREEEEGK